MHVAGGYYIRQLKSKMFHIGVGYCVSTDPECSGRGQPLYWTEQTQNILDQGSGTRLDTQTQNVLDPGI